MGLSNTVPHKVRVSWRLDESHTRTAAHNCAAACTHASLWVRCSCTCGEGSENASRAPCHDTNAHGSASCGVVAIAARCASSRLLEGCELRLGLVRR